VQLNSLINEREFPVPWLREFVRKSLALVVFQSPCDFDLPKNGEFPCFFPVTREIQAETGSQVTASTATKSQTVRHSGKLPRDVTRSPNLESASLGRRTIIDQRARTLGSGVFEI
jgi:hypothetical protein